MYSANNSVSCFSIYTTIKITTEFKNVSVTVGVVDRLALHRKLLRPWLRALYTVSQKKGCHPNYGYNFVNSWWIYKILSLLERPVNFQQNQY